MEYHYATSTATTDNGTQVAMTEAQFNTIVQLREANHGGIATIHGYKPTTGYAIIPTVDVNIITRFSYVRLLERKLKALDGISFSDVIPVILGCDKLSKLNEQEQRELFAMRHAQEVETIQNTLNGARQDAHRQGHDRCYVGVGQGIKVHLITEKASDGLKYPVLNALGIPQVDSIQVMALELHRRVREAGQYKVQNNGASVLMKNAIGKLLNQRSVGVKTFSLKPDNFERVVIAKRTIEPSDLGMVPMELLD